jgi:hypothetical protein
MVNQIWFCFLSLSIFGCCFIVFEVVKLNTEYRKIRDNLFPLYLVNMINKLKLNYRTG